MTPGANAGDRMNTINIKPYVALVRSMTSDAIRWELENLQGLILDSDDRIDWSIFNAELRARNESVVKWRA